MLGGEAVAGGIACGAAAGAIAGPGITIGGGATAAGESGGAGAGWRRRWSSPGRFAGVPGAGFAEGSGSPWVTVQCTVGQPQVQAMLSACTGRTGDTASA